VCDGVLDGAIVLVGVLVVVGVDVRGMHCPP